MIKLFFYSDFMTSINLFGKKKKNICDFRNRASIFMIKITNLLKLEMLTRFFIFFLSFIYFKTVQGLYLTTQQNILYPFLFTSNSCEEEKVQIKVLYLPETYFVLSHVSMQLLENNREQQRNQSSAAAGWSCSEDESRLFI